MDTCAGKRVQTLRFFSKNYVGVRVVMITAIVCLFADLFSQSLNFKTYSVEDGLPSSVIYMAFQDSQGFLWFGSDQGVCRYDGYKFIKYTTNEGVSDNDIFNFLEDSSGKIWVHTLNGKVSYYQNGRFINSTIDTTLKRLDGNSVISSMLEDRKGNIWISTYASGLMIKRKNGVVHRFFERYKHKGILNMASIKPDWITLIQGEGVSDLRFDEQRADIIRIEHPEFPERKSYHSKCVTISDSEILFSLKRSNGASIVYLRNTTHNTFTTFFEPNTKFVNVHGLSKDEDFIWICTGNGAIPYSLRTKKFLPAVLQNHQVSSVLRDREGNYWFTTLGDGIFFCSSLAVCNYSLKHGLVSDKINCLAHDTKNRIWIGYEKGAVSYIERPEIHSFNILKHLVNTSKIYRVNISGDKIWVVSSLGLTQVKDGGMAFFRMDGLKDAIESHGDSLLLGSGHSIVKIGIKDFERVTKDQKAYPGVVVSAAEWARITHLIKDERAKRFYLDSQHNIWISTHSNLYSFKNDSLTAIESKVFGTRSIVNGFAELPGQTLVLATGGDGVAFLKHNRKIFSIDQTHGLSSNVCNAVAIDHDGTIWVATSSGLNKIAGYPAKVNVEYFDTYDGLTSSEILDVVIANDTVWAATKKGLNFFHKDQLKKKAISPLIYLDGITVSGVPIEHKNSDLTFQHDENDIGINYTGLSYHSGGNIQYRYKLHRQDPWRYTRNTSVYLPALLDDQYEFIVACRGRTGIWSKEASVLFLVKKPFWRTYAFIFTVMLVSGALIWIGIVMYIRSQRNKILLQNRMALSELRSLRAQMNPHFLFNALNSIQSVLLKKKFDTALEYLARFGKLMRQILDHSDKTSITIAQELEAITNYLEIERLPEDRQFLYKIDIDPELDIYNIEIPAMIIQPFIENAIVHGFSVHKPDYHLLINFGYTGNSVLTISIKDNGIGRKKASLRSRPGHHSKGMNLVKERIDILNYKNEDKIELHIEDLEDHNGNHPGTLVTIKIPCS